jgi:hypothetical protein
MYVLVHALTVTELTIPALDLPTIPESDSSWTFASCLTRIWETGPQTHSSMADILCVLYPHHMKRYWLHFPIKFLFSYKQEWKEIAVSYSWLNRSSQGSCKSNHLAKPLGKLLHLSIPPFALTVSRLKGVSSLKTTSRMSQIQKTLRESLLLLLLFLTSMMQN